ncbi:DUF418 domain-containing protein [Pseudonocardia sp. H11422]|uniref:DUF418 domain-containing protein n=1 Tax=Pseudonocardia sp. H11422 TaxID=2835866 RepID=UPI001BDD3F13|nr:DUF418 domain-containing protein [Pseudonocardia sp. H11422]
MTRAAGSPDHLGATPTSARALAPDLARGGMLLLIACANVHLFLFGRPLGVRGYPRDVTGVDRVVVAAQMMLVDGRAYPLFGLLFGYGVVQLAWRCGAAGVDVRAATRIVRRRGGWMVLIGFAHGVLLFSGDIVGAYGLLAVLMAGTLVAGSPVALLTVTAVGLFLTAVFGAAGALPMPDGQESFLTSMVVADPLGAMAARLGEWIGIGLLGQAVAVFGAVALGAWAARRRLLDEPARHRALLTRVAAVGLTVAVLGGAPLALAAAGVWADPSTGALLAAGALHAVGGYGGGVGYAALFGLLAIRLSARRGPVSSALVACGQRSLTCYLAQSLVFVALLPAWTLGLGARLALWQAALLAIGTWLLVLGAAAAMDRAGRRGPAEVLLRRLTYGRPAPAP